MSGTQKHLPETFIKNIAIEINEEFDFHHHPFQIADLTKKNKAERKKVNKKKKEFHGREDQIDKFNTLLSLGKKGVFLVTGYRGMGKTSFVNHAINEYINQGKKKSKTRKDKQGEIKAIHLTMAQNNPREFDLLRQITNSIYNVYEHRHRKLIEYIRIAEKMLILVLMFFLSAKLFFGWSYIFDGIFDNTLMPNLFITLLILLLIKTVLLRRDKNGEKIRELMDRCHALVSEERGHEGNFSFISNILERGLNGRGNHKTGKQYPLADTKVIEFELIEFLKKVTDRYNFIFIIDELDKIEVSNHATNLNEDLESYENRNKNTMGSNQTRNRKQAVLNIIAGLKNFFTIAEARFIFVAGREMFDASLADVADKQSPLSSVFTYVFHIETLLKEKGEGNDYTSLSVMIENFLIGQLFKREKGSKKTIVELLRKKKHGKRLNPGEQEPAPLCPEEAKEKKEQDDRDFNHAYFMLRAFTTYLLYRCNGSPKKIIKTFLEFVHTESNFQTKHEYITFLSNEKHTEGKQSRYLYFNTSNQYRIGFINSIYRPFIIQFGRSFKAFSENTVISIPYYFDHLFKFHPFAFSISNLELIPEMLHSNKTPNTGEDLRQVINYLYQSHIRDTDMELFDYKFHSKTTNEIIYISKIFEEEGAAFNFTLDESYDIKLYLSEKIKEYRSTHSKFTVDSETNSQIFSIAALNSSLGDIYFFDQEFHDAINCYADAIRSINHLELNKINFRDFITLLRNKLKIGLCLEKINSFEEAMSFYADSVMDIKRYYNYFLSSSKYIEQEISVSLPTDKDSYQKTFYTSSLNDMLQICIQSFLSNVYIQEKMGLEGITTPKVKIEMNEFLRIAYNVSRHTGRNPFIIANWNLHHGKMLYYKNSPNGSSEHGVNKKRNRAPKWLEDKNAKLNLMFSTEEVNRQPILAYKSYLMGLDEIMKSKQYFFNYFKQEFEKMDKIKREPQEQYYKRLKANQNNFFLFEAKGGYKADFLRRYLHYLFEYIKEEPSGKVKKDVFLANHYKYIANFLSGIGDCILGMNDLKNEGDKCTIHVPVTSLIELNVPYTDCFYSVLKTSSKIDKFEINDVLRCYYLAAKFYKKYGRNASAVFEYRKIMQLMVMVLPEPSVSLNKEYSKLFKNCLLKPAESMLQTSGGRTHRHILEKVREDLVGKSLEETKWMKQKNVINQSEVKELYLLFEELKQKLGNGDKDCIENFIKPKFSIASQFLRILELELHSRTLKRYHLKISKNSLKEHPDFGKNIFQGDPSCLMDELLGFLFSRHSILRILKIYESDYVFGPSYKAFLHYEIAELLSSITSKKSIADILNNKNRPFKEDLQSLLGGKSMVLLDAEYHFGMALDYYEKATELHTAGNEYKKQIRNMIFLEDDFNDNDFHFGAAMERYLMINNFFSTRIDEIKKWLSELE